MDYRKYMKVNLDRIDGPLMFRFVGTVQQLRDYIAWAKEIKKELMKEPKSK